jgi:hypothetical protein
MKKTPCQRRKKRKDPNPNKIPQKWGMHTEEP